MRRLISSFLKNESGATAIEYGLIAAGISGDRLVMAEPQTTHNERTLLSRILARVIGGPRYRFGGIPI